MYMYINVYLELFNNIFYNPDSLHLRMFAETKLRKI